MPDMTHRWAISTPVDDEATIVFLDRGVEVGAHGAEPVADPGGVVSGARRVWQYSSRRGSRPGLDRWLYHPF
jgi:hypothetical protein